MTGNMSEWHQAGYRSQEVEIYRNNPFIETLPEILSPSQVVKLTTRDMPHSPSDRFGSTELRFQRLETVKFVRQSISKDIELVNSMQLAIATGYVHRNPTDRAVSRQRKWDRGGILRRDTSPQYIPKFMPTTSPASSECAAERVFAV